MKQDTAHCAAAAPAQIKAPVADELKAVNRLIDERLFSRLHFINRMSHCIIESRGRQLRPLLVLLATSACGYSNRKRLLLAAIIEFIHTATLPHDDVADGSSLRRGRQTAQSSPMN